MTVLGRIVLDPCVELYDLLRWSPDGLFDWLSGPINPVVAYREKRSNYDADTVLLSYLPHRSQVIFDRFQSCRSAIAGDQEMRAEHSPRGSDRDSASPSTSLLPDPTSA